MYIKLLQELNDVFPKIIWTIQEAVELEMNGLNSEIIMQIKAWDCS
jgi:hypothetical protein